MSDFFSQNSLYVVLMVALAVWAGIFLYLVRIERRVRNLEQQQSR